MRQVHPVVHGLLELSVGLVMLVVHFLVQIVKVAFVAIVLDEMVDSYLNVSFSHVVWGSCDICV